VTLSLFEISEIEHWILFVIWLLRFVISSLAKKMAEFVFSAPNLDKPEIPRNKIPNIK